MHHALRFLFLPRKSIPHARTPARPHGRVLFLALLSVLRLADRWQSWWSGGEWLDPSCVRVCVCACVGGEYVYVYVYVYACVVARLDGSPGLPVLQTRPCPCMRQRTHMCAWHGPIGVIYITRSTSATKNRLKLASKRSSTNSGASTFSSTTPGTW